MNNKYETKKIIGKPNVLLICGPSDLPSALMYESTQQNEIIKNIFFNKKYFLSFLKNIFRVIKRLNIINIKLLVALAELSSSVKGIGCIIP